MRLGEMLQILKSNADKLKLDVAPQPPYKAVLNKDAVQAALQEIGRVPVFAGAAAQLLAHEGFRVIGPDFRGEPPRIDGLNTDVDLLRQRATDLRAVLSHILPEDEPLGIFVKLCRTDDLPELNALVKDLHLALDEPVGRVLGQKLLFGGFDRGSNWLLLLAPELVLRFIASLLYLCQWYLERAAIVEANARIARSRADVAEDVAKTIATANEATRALLDADLRAHANDVLDKHHADPKAREEHLTYTVKAVKELMSLTERHVEVHLSLSAPEPVKAEFPMPSRLVQAARHIKGLLSEGGAADVPADPDADDVSES